MVDVSGAKYKHILFLLPTILVTSFIPLFVFVKIVQISGIYFEFWNGESVIYDLFTFYRSVLIITISIMMVILILLRIYKKNTTWRISFFYIPAVIYIICLCLSTIKSDYLSISLFGFNERYEGAFILASYIFFLIVAFNQIESEFDIKILIIPILLSSSILGIVGLLQFFGYDLLNYTFFRYLITPKNMHDNVYSFMQTNPGGVIHATLYNPNNVGSYTSMLFPIALGLYWTTKKRKDVIWLGIYACLMFAMWIGSRSRAGFVGVGVAVLLYIIIFRSTIWQEKKRLIIIIPFIVIFLVMNSYAGGGLLGKLGSLNPSYEKSVSENRTIPIQDIIFEKNHIQIISDANILNMFWEDQSITFTDKNMNPLLPVETNEVYHFIESDYNTYRYTVINKREDRLLIELLLKNTRMHFYFDNSGVYLVGPLYRLFNSIDDVPFIDLNGYESLGSGRGYIWSRSLPLLRDTLWIGHGPDSFPIYYPQNDFIGKFNVFGDNKIVVDKPHSFYIQVAHNTGVISLLALLVLFGFYLIQSTRLYWKRHSSETWVIAGKIIMGAVLAYLVTSIFNDSVIYVAPIFWTLLGTGFAVNHQVKAGSLAQNHSIAE